MILVEFLFNKNKTDLSYKKSNFIKKARFYGKINQKT